MYSVAGLGPISAQDFEPEDVEEIIEFFEWEIVEAYDADLLGEEEGIVEFVESGFEAFEIEVAELDALEEADIISDVDEIEFVPMELDAADIEQGELSSVVFLEPTSTQSGRQYTGSEAVPTGARPPAVLHPSNTQSNASDSLTDEKLVPVQGITELIIMTTDSDFSLLSAEGIIFDQVTRLSEANLTVSKIRSPEEIELFEIQRQASKVTPNAIIDYNHTFGAHTESTVLTGVDASLSNFPLDFSELLPTGFTGQGRKVGLLDSAVDVSHDTFSSAKITTQSFLTDNVTPDYEHGTAVLSLLAGNSKRFKGLAPDAEFFAAEVLAIDDAGALQATALEIVTAMDWLMKQEVSIINISLAGPKNRLVERIMEIAQDRGITIVASVGNNGPHAPPAYPAGAPNVVGITAVSHQHKIYRLAGSGAHVDFSAPGVLIRHAQPRNGYSVSSGTSLAAPIATAIIMGAQSSKPEWSKAHLTNLACSAIDLGVEGYDETFGYGLVQSAHRISGIAGQQKAHSTVIKQSLTHPCKLTDQSRVPHR